MESIYANYPEYKSTARLDDLRATDYGYLDKQDHLYLDFTGAGLAAQSQLREHESRLERTLLGNPHSENPTSRSATHLVEDARARILAHLGASPDEYTAVFTPNATGAARLVAEAYPWTRRSRLVLTADNHNSVNGLREFARRGNARTVYVPVRAPELRVDPADLVTALKPRRRITGSRLFSSGGKGHKSSSSNSNSNGNSSSNSSNSNNRKNGLFAYPAQSNFSGVRHPLSWVSLAQQQGYDVLLDAAAYLPTSRLDLSPSSGARPEFVIVSWYKLFGYPTGVGCLVVRRDALARLAGSRPWFSGGTIAAASVGAPWHVMAPDEAAFEDGTVNFLSIPDVRFGLDWLDGIGMDLIGTRVRCLTGWCLDRLRGLRHGDGSPVVRIYGPTDMTARGGTICFNFLDVGGRVVDERLVAAESSARNISLRTGCFCNPGAGEAAFGLSKRVLEPLSRAQMQMKMQVQVMNSGGGGGGGGGSADDYIRLLAPVGAVRISFGFVTTTGDVDRFIAFAEETYRDRLAPVNGLPTHDRC
ncbi:Putative aminotransferase class V domain, pyridoxal phosphate-dependent transferase, major [Colletotrichum destructivum]|uniref:Aminotransferase class V domain, pyridoxal phosphate-dependent transferase, major n=1 Tax=Colletotrichum destructivum TaxID=34406 RepID=A0AAX4IFC3_9PEZI|nr:Putative aminotransferase class V domain, pyridoxal phosphate-dependent transferase, major [Colletotrichum destructivum]